MVALIAISLATTIISAERPDPGRLPADQQAIFQRVTSEEFCSCDSALTLAGCLQLRADCRTADHLANLIVRGAEAGLSAEELLGTLSSRVMGPFCKSPATFNVDNAPAKGPKDAAVTLVEFADFRCSHCRTAAPLIARAAKRYGKSVRVVFMPFPLQNNPMSMAAAEASLAAGAQGKFWQMHDALFADRKGDFTNANLNRLARKIGLDMKRFEKDMAQGAYRAQVLALKEQGVAAGVEGTPSLFINGRPYDIDPNLFTLEHRFDMELDRNRGNCQ